MLFDQKSPVHPEAGFPLGDTDPRILQTIDWIGLGADSVKAALRIVIKEMIS